MKSYRLEHDEQATLFTWAKLERRFPELDLLFAIPNGGHRNMLVAKKMKAEGVRPGVPDMFLPVARGGYHGLFLEMKTEANRPKRGGKGGLSDLQLDWIERLKTQGYAVRVCYGFEEARNALIQYLHP